MTIHLHSFAFKADDHTKPVKGRPPTSCRTPSSSSRIDLIKRPDSIIKDYGEIIKQTKSDINIVSHRQKLREMIKRSKRTSKSPSLFFLKPSSDLNEFPTMKKRKKMENRSLSVLARSKCKLVLNNSKPIDEARKTVISWIHYKPLALKNEVKSSRTSSEAPSAPKNRLSVRRGSVKGKIIKEDTSLIEKVKHIDKRSGKSIQTKFEKSIRFGDSIAKEVDENEYFSSLVTKSYSIYDNESPEEESPTLEFKPRY